MPSNQWTQDFTNIPFNCQAQLVFQGKLHRYKTLTKTQKIQENGAGVRCCKHILTVTLHTMVS